MQARRVEMAKTVRARYTLEFEREAVRLVTGGQRVAAAANSLGVVDQTRFSRDKAGRQGKLKGVDTEVVTAEQMEISRLRAEFGCVKMERDILGLVAAIDDHITTSTPSLLFGPNWPATHSKVIRANERLSPKKCNTTPAASNLVGLLLLNPTKTGAMFSVVVLNTTA